MWNQQFTGVNHSELPLMNLDISCNKCSSSTSSSHHFKMWRGDRPLFHPAPHCSSRKFSTARLYCSSAQFTPQNIGQYSDGRKYEAPLFTNMNGIRFNGPGYYENHNNNVIGNIFQLQAIDNAYYRLPTPRLSCNAAASGNRYHNNPTSSNNHHHRHHLLFFSVSIVSLLFSNSCLFILKSSWSSSNDHSHTVSIVSLSVFNWLSCFCFWFPCNRYRISFLSLPVFVLIPPFMF